MFPHQIRTFKNKYVNFSRPPLSFLLVNDLNQIICAPFQKKKYLENCYFSILKPFTARHGLQHVQYRHRKLNKCGELVSALSGEDVRVTGCSGQSLHMQRCVVLVFLLCFDTVCPPLGDMRLCRSKPQTSGGRRLKGAEESPPAAGGSRLPSGTVRRFIPTLM